MSAVSSPPPAESTPVTTLFTPAAAKSLRGRWIWGLGILVIASIAQGILWAQWWEDPTHFKMSILFVWPAALFALLIWWVFFSGWSWRVRLGAVGALAASFIGLLCVYRLEWDGDMVPRRFVLRSKPRAEEVAREFFKQVSATAPAKSDSTDPASTETPPLVAVEGDWTGFRGPHRDGIVRDGSLRRNWEAKPLREVWRHPVGRAWSAFTVVGHYAFTQEQREANECVVAYDAETGSQLWVHQDNTILSIVEANGGPGPHATPQFDDGRLYTLGGTGVLNCLDAATGKRHWTTNILQDAGDGTTPEKPPEWGVSCSPLVVDDLVVVIPGGSATEGSSGNNKGVAAYDKKSGKPVWAAGKHPASYGSARIETIGDTRQVLIPNGNGLSGHALETGEELWFFPLENAPKVNSSMPWVLEDDSVLFGTGYGIGTVRLDIKQTDGKWEATRRWASNRFRPKFNDFVVREGFLFGLDDGTLTCLDVANGAIKWKSGRYGYGQVLLVGELLLIITEDGELLLLPATPTKPEPVALQKVFDSGFCWNHLALVRGRLFARNANEAACFDVAETPDGG